jgi:signal transduction histidine kinase
MGNTHAPGKHYVLCRGVENVEAIANLALLRGMIGKPTAGLLPLRGHSNVQGIGKVGVKPILAEDILQQMEQVKSEEVNHAKLQFFTNITHELLTPLTIISATVDDLKMISPQNREHYGVMQNNISRLIRLLQQILEFRKAETGNLKLKVSNDNLAVFLRKEVESLRPLMKKKKIHLSVVCDPENIMGYYSASHHNVHGIEEKSSSNHRPLPRL